MPAPTLEPAPVSTIRITKLDAARRQLRTAISLWFANGDPISIHTLAFAAYEVIHKVSEKKGRTEKLLWDSPKIKDEYRNEFISHSKKHANFFKHADRDIDSSIEFNPATTDIVILFSMHGLRIMSIEETIDEKAFIYWHMLHNPQFFIEYPFKSLSNYNIALFKTFRKEDFLKAVRSVFPTKNCSLRIPRISVPVRPG